MVDYDLVPWRAVHDYLLDIESARTKEDLFARAVADVERLIPSDVAATLFDDSGRMIFRSGFSDATQRAFNDYYRFRIPFIPDTRYLYEIALSLMGANQCSVVDWRYYSESEFVADFVRPEGNVYNLVSFTPGLRILLSLHRSPMAPIYSEIDCATLAVVSPHLSNLYSTQEKLAASASLRVTEEEIREHFPRVSKREAEVAIMLCRGLTAPEIASKLFISARTVEGHIEHLYEKLGVRSKREAIVLLTSEEAVANRT